LPLDVPFYQAKIGDMVRVEEILRTHQIAAVLHFAAFIEVGRGEQEPDVFYENNVGQSLRLLTAMRNVGVRKIIFSSTAAVYSGTEGKALREDDPIAPNNVYGRTKYMIETVLRDLASADILQYGILRYFNAAGADDTGDIGEAHHPETHLIPLVLQAALGQRNQIFVYGNDYDTKDGTCIRDYIHVNDLADAHILALEKLLTDDGNFTYNLGSGLGYSVQEVIEYCREITGYPIMAVYAPRREGDVPVLLADSNCIRQELGWQPRYNLQQIVETAWRWHKQHPNGYRSAV
jgi:UDP-glucose 4-epimerase